MIKRKYVPLRIAQPGMMIDQAIIDRAGRVLIARRTRLEDFHIDALKKWGSRVFIPVKVRKISNRQRQIRHSHCPNPYRKI